MDDDEDVYKQAILDTCAEVPRCALDVAPLPENDLGVAQVCPNCSRLDALIRETEDGELCECPDCGCNFTPKVESLTRLVIRRLTERRLTRQRKMAEMLAADPPPGMDPDDYAAFRLAVDGPDAEAATPGGPPL